MAPVTPSLVPLSWRWPGIAPLRPLVLGAWILVSVGCSRTDSAGLPEWTPADHDHQQTPSAGQVNTEERRAQMPDLEKKGINDLILATWKQNCVRCHGLIGQGDGPDGRVLTPPSFTTAAFQNARDDAALTSSIIGGRGKMPAFAHLPPETVQGLVRLIRLLAPREGSDTAPSEAGSAEKPPDAPRAPEEPAPPAQNTPAPAQLPTPRNPPVPPQAEIEQP